MAPMISWWRLTLVLKVLMVLVVFTEGLNCSQCNMRLRNVANLCDDPREMTDCIGCMKTVTKVKIRDSGYINGWERLSVVTSRYCMRAGSANVKPEGCYKQLNNGGYTERCFCYTDHCNSRGNHILPHLTLTASLAVIAMTLIGRLFSA